MTQIYDLTGNTVKADGFEGPVTGAVSAANVNVAAGTDGLSAGTAQVALQALATRVQALEDATP